jgi:hypothetical protein
MVVASGRVSSCSRVNSRDSPPTVTVADGSAAYAKLDSSKRQSRTKARIIALPVYRADFATETSPLMTAYNVSAACRIPCRASPGLRSKELAVRIFVVLIVPDVAFRRTL